MFANLREAFALLSYLDLVALAIIAWEIHRHGWPYVKAKFVAVGGFFKSEIGNVDAVVADLVHRVESIEHIMVQSKIAAPAPTVQHPIDPAPKA